MLNIASVNMPKIKPETKSKSPAEVADIFNVCKRQVERIRKRYQETGDVHDRPRSGRPCKTQDNCWRRWLAGPPLSSRRSGRQRRLLCQELYIGLSWKRKKLLVYWATSNRSTNENNSSWWQKHCESCEMQHQPVTSQTISTRVKVSHSTVQRRFRGQQYTRYNTRWKPLIGRKNRKARLQFAKKYSDEPQNFWNKVLWIDENNINIYQNDGKAKVEKEPFSERTCSWSKTYKLIMAWACMATSAVSLLIFINDVIHDGNSSAQKHTANTIWEKKCIFTGQVNHLTLTQLSMHFTSWRGDRRENPPKQTTTERGCDASGSQVWCSYCKQGIFYQILSVFFFSIYLNYICSNTFAHLKIGWTDSKDVLSSLTYFCVNTRK